MGLFDRPFSRHISAYAGPDVVDIFGRALSWFIVVKIFSVEEMGFIAMCALVFSYAALLDFGVNGGVLLKLPILYSKKSMKEIDTVVGTAMGFTLMVQIFVAAICFLPLLFFIDDWVWPVVLGVITYGLAALFYQFHLYSEIKARYTYQFRLLATAKLLVAFTRASLEILGGILFGIIGYFVAQVLCYLPSLIYLYTKKGGLVIA